MPFYYEDSPGGCLRQGEILGGVFEYQVKLASREVERPGHDAEEDDREISYVSIHHPLVIVVTPWCDLVKDHELRFEHGKEAGRLQHVLVCDLFELGNLKGELMEMPWGRIKGNRHERFHQLEPAKPPSSDELPELFVDFKRVMPMPTGSLYEAIESKKENKVSRLALVPALYREKMIHRLNYYLSRVSLPD